MKYSKTCFLLVVFAAATFAAEETSVPETQEAEEFDFDTSVEGCNVKCNRKGYKAHPSDCRKFLQCAPYGQQEMPCPPGTVWDQSQLVCAHESSTRCVVGFYKTASGKRCPGECQFECPRAWGRFPHPRDCRRFFRCKNGVALYRSCGQGKLFNAETSSCVEEGFVTCNTSPDADC